MSTKTILVVDDDSFIRKVLSETLTAHGYEPLTASDGKEGLRKVREEKPALVISDIVMPRMDGWALCEEIRREPATRTLPFIFLTTESDVPTRIKGLEMGADDYVCKPFSKEELLARVGSLLRRTPRRVRQSTKRTTAVHNPVSILSGHSDHIAVPDLIQMMSMNGKSGTLSLWGCSVGRIYFRKGRIINADTRGQRGKKALFRLMAWPEARFQFEPGDPGPRVEAVLEEGAWSVLMQGFAQLDKLRDLRAELPDERLRLRAVRAKMKTKMKNAKLTTAQRIILRTAASGATLAEIVDAVPDPDLVAYQALLDLLQRGLVEPFDPGARS
ncbi:MAG: response regulator [Acidobacteriota bacterium]